jgi:hypothetical protein
MANCSSYKKNRSSKFKMAEKSDMTDSIFLAILYLKE